MTDLKDTIAALLADPLEQLHHRRLADRVSEESPDPRAALIALVKANADSDGPRLAFAAFCEATGETDRAEFIRVQCELARTRRYDAMCKVCGNTADEDGTLEHGRGCYVLDSDGGGSEPVPPSEEWEAIARRENELMHDYPDRRNKDGRPFSDPVGVKDALPGFRLVGWDADPFAVVYRSNDAAHDGASPRCVFRRGFVASVRCAANEWMRAGDAILSEHPVARVTFTTSPRGQDWWDGGEQLFVNGPPGTHHDRWPGVEFQLPTPAVEYSELGWDATPATATPIDDLRAWRERLDRYTTESLVNPVVERLVREHFPDMPIPVLTFEESPGNYANVRDELLRGVIAGMGLPAAYVAPASSPGSAGGS